MGFSPLQVQVGAVKRQLPSGGGGRVEKGQGLMGESAGYPLMPTAARSQPEREKGIMANVTQSFTSHHRAPAISVALQLAPQVLGLPVTMSHGQGRRSDDFARLFFCVPSGRGIRWERARSCERATAMCLRAYYPSNYQTLFCPDPRIVCACCLCPSCYGTCSFLLWIMWSCRRWSLVAVYNGSKVLR